MIKLALKYFEQSSLYYITFIPLALIFQTEKHVICISLSYHLSLNKVLSKSRLALRRNFRPISFGEKRSPYLLHKLCKKSCCTYHDVMASEIDIFFKRDQEILESKS